MMTRLILLGVIGFASGIACRSLFFIPGMAALVPAVIGCALLALGAPRRSTLMIGVAILCITVTLGALRVELVPQGLPEPFARDLGTKTVIEGTVAADPDLRETSQRITVEAVRDGERTRLLVVTGLYPELGYGERIRVEGKLEEPEPFATDGGREFRYDRFLAKEGIFGMVSFAGVETLDGPGALARVRGSLFAAKHAFVEGLGRALPEPHASLAAGIIAGGKQGLGKELLEAFTIAGLLPIVVLSGYNIMIVAEGIMRSLRSFRKDLAAIIAVVVILLFVLAAGTGASAVRAGLMAGLALFARASGRTYDALRALVAVFLLMLIVNPLLLVYDPGFQFSFAATVGLIIGAPIIEPYLARIRNGFLRDIVATTIAAQLFVLPLLLYQTGNLSLVALPANVLALPMIPFAMLLSFIAGLAGIIAPSVALVAGAPAFVALAYIIAVAEGLSALPLAQIIVPAFPFWMVALLYAALAFLMVRLKRKTPAGAGAFRKASL